MQREIYEVHIAYVTAQGYHAADPEVNGHKYPIVIDSKSNGNSPELALRKAQGFLGDAEKFLSNRTDDQIDYCYIVRVSDGFQIEKRVFGELAELPDPEPTPEPEPEPEGGEE